MPGTVKIIDFFFDFMSPFAYLAHSQLPDLARRHGYELRYCPIDLPAAKAAAGNTGPPNVSIPVKLGYLRADLDRWAERYGIPITFPPSLDSTLANRGLFFAEEQNQSEDYVRLAWLHFWGQGEDMSSKDLLGKIASDMGWDPAAFLEYVGSEFAQEAYRKTNDEAHARGVFGAPIMMIGEEMWWGNDRLFLLEEYLSSN